MIAVELSKQEALDADPEAIQQINFTGNLHRDEGATTFFIICRSQRNHFRFFKGSYGSIVNLFYSNIMSI